ncbi:MAG TPA: KH domain-containing protein [Acidimicrobiales bacterium]|nr:KH domain-containing protein [Acidimicrobiales bacterium]
MTEADNTVDDFDDEYDDDEFDDGDEADEADDVNRIPAATARAVLDYLVRALVDDPDSVEVDAVEGRRGVSLRVSVAPGDMGRVIGKRGRTANAVRAVTRAAAVRDGVEVDVDFVD